MNGLIKRNRPMDLLESFFNDDFFGGSLLSDYTPKSAIGMDYSETDTEYVLEMALPGMDKNDINIEMENDYLTISSNREEKTDNSWYHRSFSKSVYLGDNVDKDNISSKMKNGILRVNMPKVEEVKTKKRIIDIE